MGKRLDRYVWNGVLGPKNERLFKWRINRRVQWLRLKRWWRDSFSILWLFNALGRPALLLLVGIGLPLFILSFSPFENHIPIKIESENQGLKLASNIEWRAIAQPLLIVIGLPTAFILWAYRDYNAKAALENQRKDINLKEFQEIQMRAAGALDTKLPAQSVETLQIAAIHQLRPFLRGEYGKAFRRPAWELLKARLATSARETGFQAISDWVDKGGFAENEDEGKSELAQRKVAEIEEKIRSAIPSAVTLAERALITEEAALIFRADLPLSNGRFGRMELSKTLLSGLDLSHASFMGAVLRWAHLEGADFYGAHLESAYLIGAHLEGAYLIGAHLEGAKLGGAHLEGAYLGQAHMEGAYLGEAHMEGANLGNAHLEDAALWRAHLEGADLYKAHLEGAKLQGAKLSKVNLINIKVDEHTSFFDGKWGVASYDDETKFAENWAELTEEEKEAARAPWRERGMRHVDEIE